VFVIFEMCAAKYREVERKYGLCPRSAWFLTQRIREAMCDNGLDLFTGTVVADETWIGGKPALFTAGAAARAPASKQPRGVIGRRRLRVGLVAQVGSGRRRPGARAARTG